MTATTYGRRVSRGDPAYRRALALVGLSLVLPGSAQLVTGHRQLGRVILRIYLALVALAIGFGLIALFKRDWAVTIGSHVGFSMGWLSLLRWGALLLGLAWAAVIVHAYVLADPPSIMRNHRLMASVATLALVVGVVVPTYWLSSLAHTQQQLIDKVFAAGGGELHERFNLLLLGGDAGSDREGLRPDSITLASIDTETGRAVLFSLPRNLEGATFPAGTALAKEWPDGFRCADDECMINGVYTWANDHPNLFPDGMSDVERGTTAMRQVVAGTLGLDVPYYAMVDLAGFEDIINALGGITINVQERVPIGGNADWSKAPIEGYIEPGLQTLNGHQALWYSRSRTNSSDYVRMARQRCVMGAILREASPQTVLTKYQSLAGAAEETISTNIPQGLLPSLVQLALKTKAQPLTSVQFVPPLIPNTAHPDIAKIQALVQSTIEHSQQPPTTAATTASGSGGGATQTPPPGDGASGTPTGIPTAPADGTPVDVDEACSYS